MATDLSEKPYTLLVVPLSGHCPGMRIVRLSLVSRLTICQVILAVSVLHGYGWQNFSHRGESILSRRRGETPGRAITTAYIPVGDGCHHRSLIIAVYIIPPNDMVKDPHTATCTRHNVTYRKPRLTMSSKSY